MIVWDQPERVGKWVCQRTKSEYVEGTAIGWEKDSQLVAGFLYTRYNGPSICMSVAFDTQYVGKDFLRYAFFYPFGHLKVNKVLAIIDSSNTKSQRFAKHCGCVLEHTIKDAGTPDMLIFTMTKEQCRFLERD